MLGKSEAAAELCKWVTAVYQLSLGFPGYETVEKKEKKRADVDAN